MLYELKCEHCNTTQEVLCPVAERDSQVCEICGNKLERKISAVSSIWRCDTGTASKGRMTND